MEPRLPYQSLQDTSEAACFACFIRDKGPWSTPGWLFLGAGTWGLSISATVLRKDDAEGER